LKDPVLHHVNLQLPILLQQSHPPVDYILDVYEELLKYEAAGKFKVFRYNEQSEKRQDELIDLIATGIVKSDFFKDNEAKVQFMKKHFLKAWKKAKVL